MSMLPERLSTTLRNKAEVSWRSRTRLEANRFRLSVLAALLVAATLAGCGRRDRGHVVISVYYENEASPGSLAATADLVELFTVFDTKLGKAGYRTSVMSYETLQDAGIREDYVWMHVNMSRNRSSGYRISIRTPGSQTSWTDLAPKGLGFNSPRLEEAELPEFKVLEWGLGPDAEGVSFNEASDLFERLIGKRWGVGFRDAPDFKPKETTSSSTP